MRNTGRRDIYQLMADVLVVKVGLCALSLWHLDSMGGGMLVDIATPPCYVFYQYSEFQVAALTYTV